MTGLGKAPMPLTGRSPVLAPPRAPGPGLPANWGIGEKCGAVVHAAMSIAATTGPARVWGILWAIVMCTGLNRPGFSKGSVV